MTIPPAPLPHRPGSKPGADDARPLGAGATPIDLRHLIPAGASAVTIAHDGQCYTLRLTRTNKLILTK